MATRRGIRRPSGCVLPPPLLRCLPETISRCLPAAASFASPSCCAPLAGVTILCHLAYFSLLCGDTVVIRQFRRRSSLLFPLSRATSDAAVQGRARQHRLSAVAQVTQQPAAVCSAAVTPCCCSDAALACVACYWCEALIAEGNATAACDLMQAAVQRRASAAAADDDVTVTLACALAVAGAGTPHAVPFTTLFPFC